MKMASKNNCKILDDEVLRLEHRRRLAQILRYIASMHHSLSLTSGNNASNNTDANNTMIATTASSSSSSFFVERGVGKLMDNDVPNFFHYTNNDISMINSQQKKFSRSNSTDTGNSNAYTLFTTDNFRTLLSLQEELGDVINETNTPFNFYKAGRSTRTTSSAMKQSNRSPFGYFKNGKDSNSSNKNGGCWMRLTRMSNNKNNKHLRRPIIADSRVRNYLEDWLFNEHKNHRPNRASKKHNDIDNIQDITDLLTLPRLFKAPKIPPSIGEQGTQRIKSFLASYQKYLKYVLYQQQIEELYNRLFEWLQDSANNTNELIWGLGHAKILLTNSNDDDEYDNNDTSGTTLVNGPLLEVIVQVELSEDGALLIRPRNHTGVVLNREVTSTLMNSAHTSSVLASLHAATAEMDPAEFSPGQPSTYVPFLKRIALEMSSNGIFQASSSSDITAGELLTTNRLFVTEAWCVYSRPKPSSVWARDSTAFADRLFSTASKEIKSTNDVQVPLSEMIVSKATISFTHGPAFLDHDPILMLPKLRSSLNSKSALDWMNYLAWWRTNEQQVDSKLQEKAGSEKQTDKAIFPLPSSDSQNRIANLLLSKDYPAVVCEGPPGTGKSHTIANMICAYLCQGKRVLVTSKNSPALRVLRYRLPKTVQELCVDVSSSESEGMRHLQQTVEKLAMRIASVNTEVEYQKYVYLKATIDSLEQEIDDIDIKLSQYGEKIRSFVRTHDGQRLVSLSVAVSNQAPWITKTMSCMSMEQLIALKDRTDRLILDQVSTLKNLTGYIRPISDDLLAYIACRAGLRSLASLSNSTKAVIATLPIIGSISGFKQRTTELETICDKLRLKEKIPNDKSEWIQVLEILSWIQSVDVYYVDIWSMYRRKDGWPMKDFIANPDAIQEMATLLENCVKIKELQDGGVVDLEEHMRAAANCRLLDARRSVLSIKVQTLSEELVDATVVSELSQNFSSDAQSALIRFAQLAGKQNFSQTTKLSKLSQRQRRRRQDYLDAFDRCCRFIPCWIMTTSQISDYLPPECLFDLAIIDESSQSDITALPGMLRGRQWLIVGDGKQVSPTETFLSEDSLESLRASLPSVPFASSMLPGQSFFDLCAQAFPRGRVVLNEHFRCAPEIIAFSNHNFYNDELVTIRLPTQTERIDPSILEVRVPNGRKVGKSNKEEADAIIKHISEIVSTSSRDNPRSIGVISLMGSEQSQLIRSGLLATIGPHEVARHDILVGDPPTFQGTERDIIFLSMVCSKGSSPTQSQLMHFQRANVAMSRARDQLILYRSLDLQDIASPEDMKIPILEFFSLPTTMQELGKGHARSKCADKSSPSVFLQQCLVEKGYSVHSMGKVWKNGISIESMLSDTRVGLVVECDEDSLQEWQLCYKQQKAIERVGWKCMRIDVLSLVCRPNVTIDAIIRFLKASGIPDPMIIYDQVDDESKSTDHQPPPRNDADVQNDGSISEEEDINDDGDGQEVVDPRVEQVERHALVSSDEEESINKKSKRVEASDDFDTTFELDASNFGETVGMDFLLGGKRKRPPAAGTNRLQQDSILQFDDQGSVDTSTDDKSMRERNDEGTFEARPKRRSDELMEDIGYALNKQKKKKKAKLSKGKVGIRKSVDDNSEERRFDGKSRHIEKGNVEYEENNVYSPRGKRQQLTLQADERSVNDASSASSPRDSDGSYSNSDDN